MFMLTLATLYKKNSSSTGSVFQNDLKTSVPGFATFVQSLLALCHLYCEVLFILTLTFTLLFIFTTEV